MDTQYWCEQIRKPVLFAQAMQWLHSQAYQLFVEIGVHPVLCGMAAKLPFSDSLELLPCLRREDKSCWQSLLSAAGSLYVRGVAINWQSFDADYLRSRLPLPTYPFQRQRYWYEPKNQLPKPNQLHPLIDEQIAIGAALVNSQTLCYQKRLTLQGNYLLQAHQILGTSVLPLAAYLEMILAAQKHTQGQIGYTLKNIVASKPLIVSDRAEVLVQTLLEPENQETSFRVVSLPKKDHNWTQHFSGTLTPITQLTAIESLNITELKRQHPCSSLTPQQMYADFCSLGMMYGAALQPVKEIYTSSSSVLALLELPQIWSNQQEYILHPAIVDGALQTIATLEFSQESKEQHPYLPYCIEQIQVFRELPQRVWCWTQLSSQPQNNADILVADIILCNENGQILVTFNQVCAKRVTQTHSFGQTPVIQPPSAKDWFYQIQWLAQPRDEKRSLPKGTWILLTDELNIGNTLSQKLTSQGNCCIQVKPGRKFQVLSKHKYIIDPESSADYDRLLASVNSHFSNLKGIFHLWTCTAPEFEELTVEEIEANLQFGAYSLLYLTQAVAKLPPQSLELWVLSTHAQSVNNADAHIAPDKASLLGVARVVSKELPFITTRCLDLQFEGNTSETLAETVWEEFQTQPTSTAEIADRNGQRWVAHLAQLPSELSTPTWTPRPDGVYLITGGQSGLGMEIAKYLAAFGQPKLILVNRSPLPKQEEWQHWLAQNDADHPTAKKLQDILLLRKHGAEVYPVAGDVTDETQMAAIVKDIKEKYGVLHGIVHCAGVLEDRTLAHMDSSTFEMVLRPKVRGAWILHRLLADEPLDFFVLFSSMAAIIGSPGQANHVAANAFMDSLAHYRRQIYGLTAMSINWGFWGETGVVSTPRYHELLKQKGIEPITNQEGIWAFVQALQMQLAQVGIVKLSPHQTVLPLLGKTETKTASEDGWQQVVQHIQAEITKASSALADTSKFQAIDRLAVYYLQKLLGQWQLFTRAGEQHTLTEISQSGRILPQYQLVMQRFLQILVADGLLKLQGEMYVAKQPLTQDLDEKAIAELINRFPEDKAQLQLIQRCGNCLADILAGRVEPLQVLFPDGSMEILTDLYERSPVAQFYNHLASQSVQEIIKHLPSNKRLRILEIGAGTGGTTTAILPALPADKVEYWFTDYSDVFLKVAKRKFADYPFVQYARLDIETPANTLDFEANSFDLIVAANVLHATSNITSTLANVAHLLQPNGFLALIELTHPQRWLDLTFGLTKGWWLFQGNDFRQGTPLLTSQQWRSVLQEQGFQDVCVFPSENTALSKIGQSLILARLTAKSTKKSLTANTPVVQNQEQLPPLPTPARLQTETTGVRSWLSSQIVEVLAQVIGIRKEEVNLHSTFVDQGVDSLMAVEAVGRLKQVFNLPAFSPTVVFEHPTVTALANYLLDAHSESVQSLYAQHSPSPAVTKVAATTPNLVTPSAAEPQEDDTVADTDIAIVGIAGRFPGADSINEFWELLRQGIDAVTEIPPSRWNWGNYYHTQPGTQGKSYSKWGGFLSQIDQFDPLFFRINPAEAQKIDPQQRLFMEVAWEALENAGYGNSKLQGSKTGVFVGCTNSSYKEAGARTHLRGDFAGLLGNALALIPNRFSYFMNFQGPSLFVDTLCSSSLVALHLACQSLRQKECRMALVGAVNVLLDPQYYVGLSGGRAQAPDGRCKTFDLHADGFVSGEGAAAIILKPLRDALSDRDRIYGIIKGSAINHNGSSNGLSAPNPRAQADLILDAYQYSGVNPEHITYVETHGTGTSLGDPIEIQGLTEAFRTYTNKSAYCAIGAVKSNIGHLEPASGLAGLVKVLLAMKHGQIPPTLHIQEPNPYLDLETTPFYISDRLRPWQPANGKKYAAISAFGMGGTNAHVVLQEAPTPKLERSPQDRLAHIFTLSARSTEALQNLVGRYLTFLTTDTETDLRDICFTANTGRTHFRHRLAVVVNSKEQLLDKLHNFASKQEQTSLSAAQIFTDSIANNTALAEVIAKLQQLPTPAQALLSQWCQGSFFTDNILPHLAAELKIEANQALKLAESEYGELFAVLAHLYCQGVEVDWDAVEQGFVRQRVALPTYPFERQRCWIEEGTPPEKQIVASHLYEQKWEASPIISTNQQQETQKPRLLLIERDSIGTALAQSLRQSGIRVITAYPNSEFSTDNQDNYSLNPTQPQHWQQLATLIQQQQIQEIIHLWTATTPPDTHNLLSLEQGLNQGLKSLFSL
ncbi:SDR family oxidoreductase, partial [Chlorogloeopsis fritschii]